MSTNSVKHIDPSKPSTFLRSISNIEDKIELCNIDEACKSATLPRDLGEKNRFTSISPGLMARWKEALRKKIHNNKKPDKDTNVLGALNSIIVLTDNKSVDEILDEETDSTETADDELNFNIKISNDSIRNDIFNMMKEINGDIKLLELMEHSNYKYTMQLIQSANPDEKQIALLWAAFLKRKDYLIKLMPETDINFTTHELGLTALQLSAFSSSIECVKLLLRSDSLLNNKMSSPDKGNSALHLAVLANSPDCVKLLLSSGADPNAVGEDGLTPLHVSAEFGYLECMRQLLTCSKEIDINAKTFDRRGHTALHIAAEEDREEVVILLLSFGSNPDIRNLRGQIPLHCAARVQSVECLQILSSKCDVNADDNDSRTPLHIAVGRAGRAAETVEYLCKESGIEVNRADRYGFTALHIAAFNELTTASAILIRYGSDLTASTKKGTTALKLVIKKTPTALYAIEEVLDSSIKISYETNKDNDVELKLDFGPLIKVTGKVEGALLSAFISEGYPELLQHPLCQLFLHLKWQNIRKFYFFRIFLSLIFILTLSLYASTFVKNYLLQHKYNSNVVNAYATAEKVTLITITVIELCRKLYGLGATICNLTYHKTLSTLKTYLTQTDNILEWVSLISALFLIYMSYIDFHSHLYYKYLCAFAVLAGWGNLMLMIGQLPLYSAYVSMYFCVVREILRLLVAYICLLIGFAFSFCIIFNDSDGAFSNPFLALVKVMVMMTGELEFQELFNVKNDDSLSTEPLLSCSLNLNSSSGTNVTKHTLSNIAEGKLLHISAHIIFVLCLLLLTVAMMNLLVGIAVNDIQGLKQSAGLAKLKRQAELIAYVETDLNVWFSCSNRIRKLRFSNDNNRQRSNSKIIHIKPHNSRLPRDIVKLAYDTAKRTCDTTKVHQNHKLSRSRNISKKDNGRKKSTVVFSNDFDIISRRKTSYIKQTGISVETENDFSSIIQLLCKMTEYQNKAIAELKQELSDTTQLLLAENEANVEKLLNVLQSSARD